MKADAKEVDTLELVQAVEACLRFGLEHFPPLAADECLSSNPNVVASQVRSRIKHGYPVVAEIIAYPRKLFGIRPVTVMSLGGRALYRALVDKIRPSLAESSRGAGKWQAHRSFGLQSSSSHIVEFDIASCYEYVDHKLLLEELVLRSGEPAISSALIALLGEVQGRGLGLPQLSYESDVLADTYLDVMTRRLVREPYETSRFADDFRVLAGSFEQAGLIIERSSEIARGLGLVLSTEKTKIFTRSTLVSRHSTDEGILAQYFTDAQEAIDRARQLVSSDYASEEDDDEDSSEEFDPEYFEFDVYRTILDDWLAGADPWGEKGDTQEKLRGLMPRVLSVLRHDPAPIDQNRLIVLAQHDAPLFESVISYIAGRIKDGYLVRMDPWDETESYWKVLDQLARQQRQTPWSKLWLIYAARIHPTEVFSAEEVSMADWLHLQLSDRHELVRGEAAWALAESSSTKIDTDTLLGLYQRATELTRPLLAACLSRVDGTPKAIVAAVKNDGPMMKEAVRWATEPPSTS